MRHPGALSNFWTIPDPPAAPRINLDRPPILVQGLRVLASPSMPDFLAHEANALEQAAGPLFPSFTIFPLHGVTAEGACACGKAGCAQTGKHPAILWREEDLAPGTKILRREDGVGVGLGLVTGQRSGGLVVIDIDVAHDGFASFEALEARIGALPDTLTVRSPSGGLHLYFRHPGRYKSCSSDVAPGVDIRGEGGMVVLPGSPHRKGGHYAVEDARPVAPLPPAWADFLPRAGQARTSLPLVPQVSIVDGATLRQRLTATAKGRKGDEWASWRAGVLGERLFRLDGMPESPAPLVLGVDEYMVKRLIWPLACTGDWYTIPGLDMASLMAPSLSILDDDAQGSKWSPDHFARKWDEAACKVAADRAESDALVSGLLASAKARDIALASLDQAAEDSAIPLPVPAVQMNRHYWLLDDRAQPRYVGPLAPEVVQSMARKLWGDRRPLECETEKGGRRNLTVAEIMETHGTPVDRIVIRYAATVPYVDDLTMIQGPPYLPRPAPLEDPAVAAWLRALDPTGGVVAWVAHASPERTADTLPALALIGGAEVGKTLLAAALARAAGMDTYTPLGRALGKFAGDVLGDGPVMFGDEGIPRDPRTGAPLTEEFRELVTKAVHKCEVKGLSRPLYVVGGVRVVLAANRLDRLFSNRGVYSGDDVAAIVRRLFVVEVYDPEAVKKCAAMSRALGASPLDPRRLERVAGHFRHLQTLDLPAPQPRAGTVAVALRAGGDTVSEALRILDDRAHDGADWIALDEPRALVWVRLEEWARGASVSAPQLTRALASYMHTPSAPCRKHPVTGAILAARQRWAALDLAALRGDGFDISGQPGPGTV